jgi:hypothetical protein
MLWKWPMLVLVVVRGHAEFGYFFVRVEPIWKKEDAIDIPTLITSIAAGKRMICFVKIWSC